MPSPALASSYYEGRILAALALAGPLEPIELARAAGVFSGTIAAAIRERADAYNAALAALTACGRVVPSLRRVGVTGSGRYLRRNLRVYALAPACGPAKGGGLDG